jgi:serine/threonine protein kinase
MIDICPPNLMFATREDLDDNLVGEVPRPDRTEPDQEFIFIKKTCDDDENLPDYIADSIPINESEYVLDAALKDPRVVFIDFSRSFKEGDHDNETKGYSMDGCLRFCPPEKEMGLHLSTKSDIWAAGILIYEFLVNTVPLRCSKRDQILKDATRLIGPMPPKVHEKWEKSDTYDEDKSDALDRLDNDKLPFYCPSEMDDPEERKMYVDFICCMLQWDPDDRWPAQKLLNHTWLRKYALGEEEEEEEEEDEDGSGDDSDGSSSDDSDDESEGSGNRDSGDEGSDKEGSGDEGSGDESYTKTDKDGDLVMRDKKDDDDGN